jgi:cation transporter-like permease
MLGAYTAVVSAFAGTVLEKWQPYSQMIPSILGVVAMLGFIIYFRRNPRALATAV